MPYFLPAFFIAVWPIWEHELWLTPSRLPHRRWQPRIHFNVKWSEVLWSLPITLLIESCAAASHFPRSLLQQNLKVHTTWKPCGRINLLNWYLDRNINLFCLRQTKSRIWWCVRTHHLHNGWPIFYVYEYVFMLCLYTGIQIHSTTKSDRLFLCSFCFGNACRRTWWCVTCRLLYGSLEPWLKWPVTSCPRADLRTDFRHTEHQKQHTWLCMFMFIIDRQHRKTNAAISRIADCVRCVNGRHEISVEYECSK